MVGVPYNVVNIVKSINCVSDSSLCLCVGVCSAGGVWSWSVDLVVCCSYSCHQC